MITDEDIDIINRNNAAVAKAKAILNDTTPFPPAITSIIEDYLVISSWLALRLRACGGFTYICKDRLINLQLSLPRESDDKQSHRGIYLIHEPPQIKIQNVSTPKNKTDYRFCLIGGNVKRGITQRSRTVYVSHADIWQYMINEVIPAEVIHYFNNILEGPPIGDELKEALNRLRDVIFKTMECHLVKQLVANSAVEMLSQCPFGVLLAQQHSTEEWKDIVPQAVIHKSNYKAVVDSVIRRQEEFIKTQKRSFYNAIIIDDVTMDEIGIPVDKDLLLLKIIVVDAKPLQFQGKLFSKALWELSNHLSAKQADKK